MLPPLLLSFSFLSDPNLIKANQVHDSQGPGTALNTVSFTLFQTSEHHRKIQIAHTRFKGPKPTCEGEWEFPFQWWDKQPHYPSMDRIT